MMVVIRYISKVLVWILTILVIIGSIGNFQTHTYMFSHLRIQFILTCFNMFMFYFRSLNDIILIQDNSTGCYCIQVWTLFCSDLLQVGQASSGGSMRTTGEPLIITPYQYLEKKLPQTM